MGGWELALYAASAALTASCAVLVSRRRPQPGALSFSYLLASETLWTLAHGCELVSERLADKLFWDNVQFVAWVALLVLTLLFAWDYTEHAPRHRGRALALFSVVPTLATLWVFTDGLHGMARATARIEPVPPFGSLLYDFSGPEQLLVAQTYGTLLYVSLTLAQFAWRAHRVHRLQALLVIFGLLVPTLASTLGLLGLRFFGQRDASPLCFGIAALPITWALGRRRFLDLVPIARHLVLERIPDAVLVVDGAGRVIDVNPCAQELLPAAMGRPVVELVPALDPTFTSGEVTLGERVFEVRSESLERAGRVILLRDVSERKRAERELARAREELEQRVAERTHALAEANRALETRVAEKERAEHKARESEQRFRALFDSSYQLIGTVASDGTLTEANRTSLEFAGVPADAVLGKPFWEGPWWSHSAALQDELRQAIARALEGELVQLQVTHPDPAGQLRAIDFSLKPLAGGSAGPYALLAEGRDITALYRAEQERAQLREQLHHSQKLDSIGRLAGGVAHDFNNLLTIILGQLELARARAQRGQSPIECLARAEDAGQSAAALTRQLLMFARKQPLEPRVVQVNDVVGHTQRMLCRVMGEHIRIELDLAAELAPVYMDESQLEQVLLNLAVNARDAMPEGGVLTVATRQLDTRPASMAELADAHAYVCLRVRDSGVGMSKDVAARAFEPFFTTKEAGKGTGIGLATVHGVVTRAGGAIALETAEGAGTTFDVVLPATRLSRASVPPPAGVPRGKERVVLVEDQATLRELMQHQLGLLGYEVLPWPSAEEALGALVPEELSRVDLLVTDVVLSGMNGATLAEQLRRARADLPVLFMSGYADEVLLARGVDAVQGTHFISKPYSFGDLARAMRRALETAP